MKGFWYKGGAKMLEKPPPEREAAVSGHLVVPPTEVTLGEI